MTIVDSAFAVQSYWVLMAKRISGTIRYCAAYRVKGFASDFKFADNLFKLTRQAIEFSACLVNLAAIV